MTSVGPELPPHLSKRKHSTESEDEENFLLPTKIQAASLLKERRILGPAPPPAPLDERPSQLAGKPSDNNSSGDDDDDDDDGDGSDDYGPSLPPAPGSAAAYEIEVQLRTKEAAPERAEAARPQREEWMLVPPKDSDWGSRVDPTKLKNRKFASGKGAKAPAEKSGISAIWTETPEQKRQRLEDEVMGRKDPSLSSTARKPRKVDAEAEATARRVSEYNKSRGQSLYDEHTKASPREKDDDPSKRAFDKEKDMALGGRVGHVQKKDMLKRAGEFESRFERGNYL